MFGSRRCPEATEDWERNGRPRIAGVTNHRPFHSGCAIFGLIVLVAGVPLHAQSPDVVRDTVLENGLQVIVVPNHTAPVATIEVVVRAGAFTQIEPPDQGLPHVLEHMLFRTYGGSGGFRSYAADVGATYNGTTGNELVTYFMTLPSDKVERGLELLGRLVSDPNFSRRELEDERLVVRGELERLNSDPYAILDQASDMVLWGPAFQRKNTIGNMTTILATDRGRLRDHYQKYYVPNNAALIVSGAVDMDRVFDWAHDGFRRWDDQDDPFDDFELPRIVPLARDTAFVLQGATDVTFLVKWHGPSVSHDPVGTLAADVFSEIFNQATSGPRRRLVDTGVFQAVTLGYQTLEHVGPIRLSARTAAGMSGPGLTALGAELARLGNPDYFDEDDLAAAKRRLLVGHAISKESVQSAAHTLAYLWAVAGLDYYLAYEQGLQDVTMADVRAYIDRYLLDRPKVVAALVTAELAPSLEATINDVVGQWPRAQ